MIFSAGVGAQPMVMPLTRMRSKRWALAAFLVSTASAALVAE